MSAGLETWTELNQRHLVTALGEVRRLLERRVAPAQTAGQHDGRATHSGGTADSAPPALDMLCELFGLSPFERAVLLLCAGMELDGDIAQLCAAAQHDPSRAYPTFSLALAALPGAHWSALTPVAPLRRWRLIEVALAGALTLGQLRIDERVLHYLAGVSYLDERLSGYVRPLQAPAHLAASQQALVERIAATWGRAIGSAPLPPLQLCGADPAAAQAIAAGACAMLELNLSALPADLLPAAPDELNALILLWEREAALSNSALLLDCRAIDRSDSTHAGAVARFVERIGGPLLVSCRERFSRLQRATLAFDVPGPSPAEQRTAWQHALGDRAAALNGHVEQLVAQFNLSTATIGAAGLEVVAPGSGLEQPVELERLWDACRVLARPQLDELAQRIEPSASWDDLVLPDAQLHILHTIVMHVRQRARVYFGWGFDKKGSRGLGISALFAGASGTGKTLAAEVLARELRLDLYRVDLSQVVSKYIGETEKNLRRVFDAAEQGGAVLLFDEADALFGKRSEVKDSHDRYANIEISYLLQRMEAYRGLAILTTNLKHTIDTAFMRRLRFVVQFPFPDAAQRAEIWRRIFPAATPIEQLELAKLARLNIAGGNIRNIALDAAFRAADRGEPVGMAHLAQAARAEYIKLEKPLTDAEIGGWG